MFVDIEAGDVWDVFNDMLDASRPDPRVYLEQTLFLLGVDPVIDEAADVTDTRAFNPSEALLAPN